MAEIISVVALGAFGLGFVLGAVYYHLATKGGR